MKNLLQATIFPGQTVVLRTDFDVPLQNREIGDTFRLQACLPSLRFLLQKGAKVVLLSHLGRPHGQAVAQLSLSPIALWLKEQGLAVTFLPDFNFDKIKPTISQSSKQLFLLENLRFCPKEEKNEPRFAQELASLGQIYVNDAFAVSHRRHASIVSLPQLLPSFLGLHFQQEIDNLQKALTAKEDLIVVLGGAKVETKIPVIQSLVAKKAICLLAGLVGNVFLSAFLNQKNFGGVIIAKKDRQLAQKFLQDLDQPISFAHLPGQTTQIWLPLDLLIANPQSQQFDIIDFTDESGFSFKNDQLDYGLGPKTVNEFTGLISQAKAVIFNGPLSRPHPTLGEPDTTLQIAQAIADSQAFSVVGGGDTLAALANASLLDKMDYASTGGGAMIEYLGHGTLPGIEAIENKPKTKDQKWKTQT